MLVLFLQVIIIPKRNTSKRYSACKYHKEFHCESCIIPFFMLPLLLWGRGVYAENCSRWRRSGLKGTAMVFPIPCNNISSSHASIFYHHAQLSFVIQVIQTIHKKIIGNIQKSTKSLETCMFWNELYNLWNRNNAILFFQISRYIKMHLLDIFKI